MDITAKNAEFQEKSMNFLDNQLKLQKAHDIFKIRLDSFIDIKMSGKMQKIIIFYIFSTNKLVYYYYIFDLICIFLLPYGQKKSHKDAQQVTYAKM